LVSVTVPVFALFVMLPGASAQTSPEPSTLERRKQYLENASLH